jgi:hypothetical protein
VETKCDVVEVRWKGERVGKREKGKGMRDKKLSVNRTVQMELILLVTVVLVGDQRVIWRFIRIEGIVKERIAR